MVSDTDAIDKPPVPINFRAATQDYLHRADWLTDMDGPRIAGARALAEHLDAGFSVAVWDRYRQIMAELADLRIKRMAPIQRLGDL